MTNLSREALDWAAAHIARSGDSYVLPSAFEFRAIEALWSSDVRALLRTSSLESWVGRPHRRCLAPKHRFGFRLATQLDPLDSLVLAASIYELGEEIEQARLAEGDAVFSYRFSPDAAGGLFDPSSTYEGFRSRSGELASDHSWVVVADIADFFPRLYLHPLENALVEATGLERHIRLLIRLLKHWNGSVSYGVPVGPAPIRLLAELTIADVDGVLKDEGIPFCRWSDDYRLFADTERRGHEALAILANALFEGHGLTLQPQKTEILDSDSFRRKYLASEPVTERRALDDQFETLVESLGLESPYEPIEYEELDDEDRALVDGLNLEGLLREQLGGSGEPDAGVIRFLLNRLHQVNDESAAGLVLENLTTLYPFFPEVVAYLSNLRMWPPDAARLNQTLLDIIDSSVVGHLEYHRAWLLDAFARSPRSGVAAAGFARLHERFADTFTRCGSMLALGQSGHSRWFRTRRRDFWGLGPWERRSFLVGASCLPGDQAEHWYRSVRPRLDPLEELIVDWAVSTDDDTS